jgi:DNA-binding response OmpR family regulator
MEPTRHTSVVRFGAYEVCFQAGEVRRAGIRIRIQQQPMKLLEILLERPGEVVTREGVADASHRLHSGARVAGRSLVWKMGNRQNLARFVGCP